MRGTGVLKLVHGYGALGDSRGQGGFSGIATFRI